MVTYMMDRRGEEIKNLIVETSTTTVIKTASVISSVVYINDE
jgi:arginine decarboxylase